MNLHRSLPVLVACILFAGLVPFLAGTMSPASAQPTLQTPLTPQQRKELAAINKEVGDVARQVRRKKNDEKKIDEAEQALDVAEQQLDALIEGGVSESDMFVVRIKRGIESQRRAIAKTRGDEPEKDTISFSDDVAPIIQEHCLSCHGANDPKGGLRLDTVAGWKQGGASKLPLGRVLPLRLTTPNPRLRMPRDAEALSPEELATIAAWMKAGAEFDSADDAPIGEKAGEMEPVVINKPDGDETVSFVKDVAPFVVNICGQCHAGNNPRGGYDMTTFEGIMRGGESGQVIEPGDTEASRLWLMVSNKEQPRMPPGQLLITRPNYNALTTWIEEGATFDGVDPKKPLRDLIPTEGEMMAEQLAGLNPQQFAAHRITRSDAHWKRAFPRVEPQKVETAQVVVYGDAGEPRLKEVAGWADEQIASLGKSFDVTASPIWKGKLAVFVLKERFGYEEFAISVNNRTQVPTEIHSHAIVTPDYNDAYLVLEDIGDEPSASTPGMKALLTSGLTQAFLIREGAKIPDWAVQGTGLHRAAALEDDNPYFTRLRGDVRESLSSLRQPDQLFANGTFSPTEAPVIGAALVDFLIRRGGAAKYAQFLSRVGQSGDTPAALRNVYGATPAQLGTAFLQSVGGAR